MLHIDCVSTSAGGRVNMRRGQFCEVFESAFTCPEIAPVFHFFAHSYISLL